MGMAIYRELHAKHLPFGVPYISSKPRPQIDVPDQARVFPSRVSEWTSADERFCPNHICRSYRLKPIGDIRLLMFMSLSFCLSTLIIGHSVTFTLSYLMLTRRIFLYILVPP